MTTQKETPRTYLNVPTDFTTLSEIPHVEINGQLPDENPTEKLKIMSAVFEAGSKFWSLQVNQDLAENNFYHYVFSLSNGNKGVLQNGTLKIWVARELVTVDEVLKAMQYGLCLDIPSAGNYSVIVYYLHNDFFLFLREN